MGSSGGRRQHLGTLSTAFALRETWDELAGLAVQLAHETLIAEEELLQRPALARRLGLPCSILSALEASKDSSDRQPPVRVMRFDFHSTPEGWRISEANTDVPGGYNEASGYARLMQQFYPGMQLCGDPVVELGEAIRKVSGEEATVALVHATGFSDDRQVMTYLARQWNQTGLRTVMAGPDHIQWQEESAHIRTEWFNGPVDFLFRFFPGEWLPNLGRRYEWRRYFAPPRPICNPATALAAARRTCSWTVDGTKEDDSGDSGNGNIALRRV